MSSVPPRTTYKVRAFILSFHFGRKKWTTYDGCLPLEILVLAWCDSFFPPSFWEIDTSWLKTKTQESKTTKKSCWEQQTHQQWFRDTNKCSWHERQSRVPFVSLKPLLLWQFSSLRFNAVDTTEPSRPNANYSKAAVMIIHHFCLSPIGSRHKNQAQCQRLLLFQNERTSLTFWEIRIFLSCQEIYENIDDVFEFLESPVMTWVQEITSPGQETVRHMIPLKPQTVIFKLLLVYRWKHTIGNSWTDQAKLR